MHITDARIPCVVVSSTFYDLRQIRADLEEFISSELGYSPLLLEFSSFPVDPDRSTIDNCKAQVEKHSHILVLIIGGRLGCVE